MNLKETLMIKFYVVDGISYPAAETAIGHFNGHGYESMRVCRNAGITNAKFKGSMTLSECVSFLSESNLVNILFSEIRDIDIEPLEYYLNNSGFGVTVNETELIMIEQYFVNGTPYVRSEEIVNLHGKKGFEAMYAVCKFGGFYGAKNKGSMNLKQFQERKNALNI